MTDSNIEKYEKIDICTIYDYFNDHPIMFMVVGLSIMILATCKLLDNKYNKGE